MTVVGADWARRGWVGVVLADGPPRVLFAPALDDLVARVPDAAVVGVDMPIGLPHDGPRACDQQAREFVGPRRSSVFMTPPRAVLDAVDYAAANAVAPELLGHKISQQAWALRHNIRRVAAIAAIDDRLAEVHPEVSFAAMAGAHMTHAKTTWNGQMARRAALEREGIVLPDDLGPAGEVPVADVLDAAAVAWTARRIAGGSARSLPDGAPADRTGAIWY